MAIYLIHLKDSLLQCSTLKYLADLEVQDYEFPIS